MNQSSLAAIVLAAGEGSRMQSARPKILHEIANRPMIGHVLAAVAPLGPTATVVAPALTVIQHPPRGTADAVRAARPAFAGIGAVDDILVLYGDTPLLRSETLAQLLAARRATPGTAVAVAGMRPADPGPYG